MRPYCKVLPCFFVLFFLPQNCLLTFAGVLHLMETGDVQKKDLIDHPENYILLTTLDEGMFNSLHFTKLVLH